MANVMRNVAMVHKLNKENKREQKYAKEVKRKREILLATAEKERERRNKKDERDITNEGNCCGL